MSQELPDLDVLETDRRRGIATDFLINMIVEARDRLGVLGLGGALVVVYFVSYFLFGIVFGTAGSVIGSSVTFLAGLTAWAYTGWVGFTAYEESSDRERARTIRSRPSIDTVEDAFALLTSPDPEAREHAAACLTEVVALGPQKVVSMLGSSAEEVVEYLVPRLEADQSEVRAGVAQAVSYFARDYPDAVAPYREDLLAQITAEDVDPDVRGDLAMTVGYLSLTQGGKTDTLEETGLDLADHSNPRVRVGACYMLAGAQTDRARQKLRDIAENDPDTEVRNHAEELY